MLIPTSKQNASRCTPAHFIAARYRIPSCPQLASWGDPDDGSRAGARHRGASPAGWRHGEGTRAPAPDTDRPRAACHRRRRPTGRARRRTQGTSPVGLAAGARSSATAGTGGSRRPPPLASADLPACEATPPRRRDAQGPRPRRVPRDPGRQAPGGDLTRAVPGDVSVRTPAKTRRYLATVPGRLGLASAPRHGSWPDLVEGLLSRTARRTLRGIRAPGRDEPGEGILS